MPSEKFAGRIKESLAPGERYEDFAHMFDTLVQLRRPFHEDPERSEEVVGGMLCIVTPDKPKGYLRAMQEFRLRYAQVSSDPHLQASFSNGIRQAALTVGDRRQIVWTPSAYFVNPWRDEMREGWF